ncbi:DNA mismatch repair protein MutL [Catellatospora sp. NPDC049609]|uniref:DNA mismatch repair protein MutL n=1 Tax=Catellatospora sp. NPDC049609 TaxID=3155505 RepID=UPI003414ECE8
MRSAAYVCGWAAVTALSASVVWVGLRPVLAAAVPEPVPLRVEALAGQPSPLPAPSRPVPTAASVTPSPSASVRPPSSPATVRVSPSAGKPAPKPSQAPAPETVDGWQVFTESDGSRSYLRSFPTEGGTAVVRIAHEQVHLVSATPRGDYRVATSQPGPDRVVVQFHNSARQIIVDAIWWEGRPYAQVTVVD